MSSANDAFGGGLAEWSWQAAAPGASGAEAFSPLTPLGVSSIELPKLGPPETVSLAMETVRPGVVSVPIRGMRIKTRGFAFPAGADWTKPATPPAAAAPACLR